jgi:hypothetical protein
VGGVVNLHLAQLLCQKRHCICGLMYDRDAHTTDEIDAQVIALFAEMQRAGVDPSRCGLCGSRELRRTRASARARWDAAVKELRESEAAQQATRAFMQRSKN